MRTPFIIAIIVAFSLSNAYSQNSYKKTTIEVLDKVEKTFKKFGGESEAVRFSLVRKTVNKESLTFVSVEIANVQTTEIIKSSGVTVTSNLDVSISSGGFKKQEKVNETIILGKEDLEQIANFLNETIIHKSEPQDHAKGWALEINDLFKIALLFEVDAATKWKYYLALNDAQFEIPFNDGINLLKKLLEYNKRIDSGN
jgi:hypothetical protein